MRIKKTTASILFFLLTVMPCTARDFVVEFDHENYKEEKVPFSYSPLIYHSIQVRTSAGPKLLILIGDDYHYRTWLRHYIAAGKAFLAKVPDDRADEFIANSAFEIDVTMLHPLNLEEYKRGNESTEKERVPVSETKISAEPLKPGTRAVETDAAPPVGRGTLQTTGEKRRQERTALIESERAYRAEADRQYRDGIQGHREALRLRLLQDESNRRKEREERHREFRRQWSDLQSAR